MRDRAEKHPLPLRLMVLCVAMVLSVGACRDGDDQSVEAPPEASDATAGEPTEIDLPEVKSACDDVRSRMDTVDAAAEGLEKDLLIDRVPYQDRYELELNDHLAEVELLESLLSGTDLGHEVTARADAVDAVLVELESGDETGLADALDRVSETRGPVLDFCER
ncbi:hypothetical protein [Nocardiopsis alba]